MGAPAQPAALMDKALRERLSQRSLKKIAQEFVHVHIFLCK
jgi:hypothetical protein